MYLYECVCYKWCAIRISAHIHRTKRNPSDTNRHGMAWHGMNACMCTAEGLFYTQWTIAWEMRVQKKIHTNIRSYNPTYFNLCDKYEKTFCDWNVACNAHHMACLTASSKLTWCTHSQRRGKRNMKWKNELGVIFMVDMVGCVLQSL